MGWTKDTEARTIIAQKAQDAYAAARQAMSKAEGSEARAVECMGDVGELRAEVATLRGRLATLERQFIAATDAVEPKRAKPVRIETVPRKAV